MSEKNSESENAENDADERWRPGAMWELTRPPRDRFTIASASGDGVAFTNGAITGRRGMTHENGWRYVGRPVSEAPCPKPTAQAVACGDVTIAAPDGMTLGEVWAALKTSPALRVCLEAELRAARESARGTTPADLETARRDIRLAVLEDAFRAGVDHAKLEQGALLAEIQRLRTRDARIPSFDQLDALLAKYRAQSHGEPIDLLGAIQTAEARAEAARSHVDPNVRRVLLLDCAAWALAAVCEIDGAQASAPVAVTREANDEGSGP